MELKYLKKSNQEFIKKWQNIMYFDDPFCDFDLIFSAAYSGKGLLRCQFTIDLENMEQLIFLDLEMGGSYYFIFKLIFFV